MGHPTLRGESAAERAARARESGEFEQQVLERAARFKSILSRQVPPRTQVICFTSDFFFASSAGPGSVRYKGDIFVQQTENVSLRIVRQRTVREPNWGKARPSQGDNLN